jgi:uncharacterized damage-inducible protein DinB
MSIDTASSTAFLARHAPAPRFDVAPAVLAARRSLAAAVRDLAAVSDESLERTWRWRDTDADVRYGLFRAIEAVEAATAEVTRVLAATGATAARGTAALRIAPVTTARWSLHGRLVALDDGWLDRVPKPGEWTLRETLGHVVGSQRGYTVYTTWHWRRNSTEPVGDAERDGIDAEVQIPEESDEASGSMADIRARLDETTDLGATLAGWTDADLARPARWSGVPVDVGFRLGRTSSHVMEHAIQVDKTLAWLGHTPTEAQRIVLDLCSAWGRLESHIFPMEPAALDVRGGDGRSVSAILDGLRAELDDVAVSVPAAAAVS